MSDTLYIQLDRNIKVSREVVTLGDIAQVVCSNPSVEARNKVRKVLSLPQGKYGRYVFSVLDIVDVIQREETNVDVTPVGEPAFILTYEKPGPKSRLWSWVKTAGVCVVTFFGTAFSIMTFNTDVDIHKLFENVYQQFTGQPSDGFTILEVTYSLGIGIGAVFFFNHFGKKKLTSDPTPMQVEMRLYEEDVDTTILEQTVRKEQN